MVGRVLEAHVSPAPFLSAAGTAAPLLFQGDAAGQVEAEALLGHPNASCVSCPRGCQGWPAPASSSKAGFHDIPCSGGRFT